MNAKRKKRGSKKRDVELEIILYLWPQMEPQMLEFTFVMSEGKDEISDA